MSNDSELFRVSVKAVIRVGDGVLVLRKFDGEWDLPGGRLKPNEDILQSLHREMLEEIGIPVSVGPLIHCGVRRRGPPKQNVVIITRLCTIDVPTDQIVLSEEHTDVRLLRRHELAGLAIADSYREALECAFDYMHQG